jgi:hypothetical protein
MQTPKYNIWDVVWMKAKDSHITTTILYIECFDDRIIYNNDNPKCNYCYETDIIWLYEKTTSSLPVTNEEPNEKSQDFWWIYEAYKEYQEDSRSALWWPNWFLVFEHVIKKHLVQTT